MPKKRNMQTLRILNIGQNYRVIGGADRYYFNLEKLLTSRGHTVIPFAARNSENLPSPWSEYFPNAIDFDNPRVWEIGKFFYSRDALKRLEKLIAESRPDIAHLHIYYGKLTSSILGVIKRHKIPIVQTLHDYKTICPVYTLVRDSQSCELCSAGNYWRAIRYKCNRSSLVRSIVSSSESYLSYMLGSVRNIDRFIAISDFQRKKLISRGLPDSRTSTIHNFVSTNLISATVSCRAEHFLYFGRIEKEKGIYTLVEAAARIKEFPLIIAGTGKDAEGLKGRIRELGAKHINFVGFKSSSELQTLIDNALCVVVPSEWYEPFGLVLLEALARGKSVIASRIGAIPEIIQDGINGLLFEPSDANSLEASMRSAIHHRDRMMEMGVRGQTLVQKHFSEDVHYQLLADIYYSLR